jgi:hypothetical protein
MQCRLVLLSKKLKVWAEFDGHGGEGEAARISKGYHGLGVFIIPASSWQGAKILRLLDGLPGSDFIPYLAVR